jgi:enoyl-CoA hydratase
MRNGMPLAEDEILLERRGGVGLVTLNRPQALNTLSLAIYRRCAPQLLAWERDPSVHAVLVRGAGDRAFCAGGDVRAIYEAHGRPGGGKGLEADFFREEYAVIERIHRFAKPHIALMDGITMGGGAGISVNGSFRVATERTLFAMPEVHIGLFPDVGASLFLNRCPGRIGLYLALTGSRIGAADALYCGFATHYVPHDRLADLTNALAGSAWQAGREHAQAADILASFAADPGAAPLETQRSAIDRCFAGETVEAILAALEREGGPWAEEAASTIAAASPLSLKITFRQLRLGVPDLRAALTLEYRLTQHVLASGDFFEGVRATLVDKDRRPRWRHRSLAEVSPAEVEGYFARLGERELILP